MTDRGPITVADAEKLTGIGKRQVSRWRRFLKAENLERYRQSLYQGAYARAMSVPDTIAGKWTGNPESYTPAEYVEAARSVMGGIDLDPASNEFAQKTVRATQSYSENEDGLSQKWMGRVFLNPPYSSGTIDDFVTKLCEEHTLGDVTSAILLTNNNTDTRWWHTAAGTARAVCFTLGRINFYGSEGVKTQPTNGQTFFYFGMDVATFAYRFQQFGLVMVKV